MDFNWFPILNKIIMNIIELDNLCQQSIKTFPVEDVYGTYKKPLTLIKLENLVAINHLDLKNIGFFLYDDKPYMPAPTDIIQFATTGGDGCYFAFLTDYGYYENLEEAPIVFICPADFDERYPYHANKLFAKNIRDFLRIMITMQYAEIVRFKNLIDMDFEYEINIMKADIESNSNEKEIIMRNKTIEILKSEFQLNEFDNLNDYYTILDLERKKENYINLKDGLGIKTLTANHTFGNDFSVISTLEESLSKASKLERVKFYREAPYIYHYFSDEYQMVTLLIAKYLYLDGFIRESKILNFELEQNIKSKKYLGARKVMLEKSKN
jgi:hypothetical protein